MYESACTQKLQTDDFVFFKRCLTNTSGRHVLTVGHRSSSHSLAKLELVCSRLFDVVLVLSPSSPSSNTPLRLFVYYPSIVSRCTETGILGVPAPKRPSNITQKNDLNLRTAGHSRRGAVPLGFFQLVHPPCLPAATNSSSSSPSLSSRVEPVLIQV